MCPELRSHFRTFLSTVFTRCVQKLVSYGSTATPPAVAHTKRKTYFILKYPSIDILSLLNSYPRKRIRGTEHNKNKLVQRGITGPLRSPSKRGWKKLRHNTPRKERGGKKRGRKKIAVRSFLGRDVLFGGRGRRYSQVKWRALEECIKGPPLPANSPYSSTPCIPASKGFVKVGDAGDIYASS